VALKNYMIRKDELCFVVLLIVPFHELMEMAPELRVECISVLREELIFRLTTSSTCIDLIKTEHSHAVNSYTVHLVSKTIINISM